MHWLIKANAASISEQKISWLSNSLTGFAMGTFGFTSVLLASLRATEANSGNQFTSTLKLKRKSVSQLQKKAIFVYIFPTPQSMKMTSCMSHCQSHLIFTKLKEEFTYAKKRHRQSDILAITQMFPNRVTLV